MDEKWSGWFLDIEAHHNRIVKFFFYLLKTGGGLVWPLLCLGLLYISWETLSTTLRITSVSVFVLLFWIPLVYPCVWRHHFNKRRNWLREIIDDDSQMNIAHFIMLSNFCDMNKIWEKLDGEPKQMRNLLNNIKSLNHKLEELYRSFDE